MACESQDCHRLCTDQTIRGSSRISQHAHLNHPHTAIAGLWKNEFEGLAWKDMMQIWIVGTLRHFTCRSGSIKGNLPMSTHTLQTKARHVTFSSNLKALFHTDRARSSLMHCSIMISSSSLTTSSNDGLLRRQRRGARSVSGTPAQEQLQG